MTRTVSLREKTQMDQLLSAYEESLKREKIPPGYIGEMKDQMKKHLERRYIEEDEKVRSVNETLKENNFPPELRERIIGMAIHRTHQTVIAKISRGTKRRKGEKVETVID